MFYSIFKNRETIPIFLIALLFLLFNLSINHSYTENDKLIINKPFIIVLLGHPGAGKGTFAQAIKYKKFHHISVGDFLRSELEKKSDIGLRWKKEIDENGILSVEVIKEVTNDLMNKINISKKGVYILDGHVRTLDQAKHLDEILKKTNISSTFIFINTDKKNLVQRILSRRTCKKCGHIYNLETAIPKKENTCDYCNIVLNHRNTDNKINAENRIDKYEPHLKEIVKYYKNSNRLIELNGNLSMESYIAKCKELFE